MRTAALILALALPLAADEVRLKDGRVIEGKVVEDGDTVRVQGQHGAVSFSRDKVAKITIGPTRREQFGARRASLAADDIDGLFELAGWCDVEGFLRERDELLARCLELDPQHDGANEVLGRVKFNGKWMTAEEAAEAQGLVNWGGEWIPKEEKALRDALSAEANLAHQVRRRVAELTLQQVQGDRVQREEAAALLSEVPPESRLQGLSDALDHSDAEVRSFAAEGLATLGGKDAVQPLAERVLAEGDKAVYDSVVAALRGIEGADPTPIFAARLTDKDVDLRFRAEIALGEFPNESVAPILVDMLENTTYYQGGTALIVEEGLVPPRDGRPRPALPEDQATVMMERERKALRYALSRITGVDMGLDIARWRVILELIRKRQEKGK
ncbi:MAG: HEAT repeat domain-containing protein [Planctomycetota bacterium]